MRPYTDGAEPRKNVGSRIASPLARIGKAFCRRFLVGLALCAAMTAVGLGLAEARIGRALDGALGQLTAWPSGALHGEERLVTVNGLEIRVISSSVDLTLDDTLDAIARRCRSMTGFDPKELSRAAAAQSWGPFDDVFDGVIRWQGEDRGVIACLDTGGHLTVKEFKERAKAFLVSHDLADIGHLRFAQARAQPSPNRRPSESRTAVLWLWTEGHVRIDTLFPTGRDAPGFDPPAFGLLRPVGSKRTFSAAELGQPYAVALYTCSNLTVADARAEVLRRAQDASFSVAARGDGFSIGRGADQLLVDVVPSATGGAALRVAQLGSSTPRSGVPRQGERSTTR